MIKTKSIKFYLDKKINKSKKDKIIEFLEECKSVENYLLDYYWNNYNVIINSTDPINFRQNNTIHFTSINPILKSHHFYQVLRQCFWTLKALQIKMIKQINFCFEDKMKQRVYNYCKPFCFQWDNLVKSINKQINKNKKDKDLQKFITKVNEYVLNEDKFKIMKFEIESEFYKIKSKFKTPYKDSLQIWIDTYLTTEIEKTEFNWIFKIDNNKKISPRKYDYFIIPCKFSDYHKGILLDKEIKKTMNLKLNKNNNIEVSIIYEEDIVNPNPISTPIDYIGIDIGLKKLITDSNGYYIEQNKNIIHKANIIINKQSNRDSLESHLRKKYKDDNFKLSDKRYLIQQCKLSDFVKNDNRNKVKKYLLSHIGYYIIMENLNISNGKTYDKKTNYLLRRLRIQFLKNDILKYAEQFGITISLINPAFTSQQCPCCGHISKDNRKTQEMFCCVECGYENNADINASINIKNRLFINNISLNTPYWKVKEILLSKYN